VLADLGADTKQTLVVFNKIDKVADEAALANWRRHFPDAVFISLKTGAGLEELIDRISEFVGAGTVQVELRLPAARADLLSRLHRDGTPAAITYEGDLIHVFAAIPKRALETFSPYVVNETDQGRSHSSAERAARVPVAKQP
jgi:GTP-binding protein HflX